MAIYIIKDKSKKNRISIVIPKDLPREIGSVGETIVIDDINDDIIIADKMKLLIDDLGQDVTLHLNSKNSNTGQMRNGVANLTQRGICVKKNSIIDAIENDSIQDHVKIQRDNTKKDRKNMIKKDVVFNDPSPAGEFVKGCTSNGWDDWKIDNEISLNDYIRDKYGLQ